jgi:hypothetical protein
MKPTLARATAAVKERGADTGGRVGDGADALLARFGAPGKLAAKASLGSRAVSRLTPDLGVEDGEPDEDEARAADPEAGAADDADVAAEGDREEPGDGREEPEDDRDDDQVDREEHQDDGEDGEFEHAYSDAVKEIEHHEAYADVLG